MDAPREARSAEGGAYLSAQGVAMRFPSGVAALEGVDLAVARGEFVSLVGPSGCGKSTLLRLAAGLLAPTAGRLTVAGTEARRARRIEHEVAFVFQAPTLLPWRTVEDNVRLPLELLGEGTRAERERRIGESLARVGLAEFRGAYPHQLSGGMRMRVSIARALTTQPDVLLLDEPFGALDEITRQRLNEELLALWGRAAWTTLFVTHNVYEAVFMSQRVVVMSARPGRVVRDIAVPFPYPRDPGLRGDPEFARLAGEVGAALRSLAE